MLPQALDTSSTLGDLTVVRSTYEPASGTWTNGHTWTITFVHQTVDFADLTVDGTNLAGAAAETVTVGTETSPITNVEADAANVSVRRATVFGCDVPARTGLTTVCSCVVAGAQVQVNEVQLIECPCAATCSGSTKFVLKHGVSVAVDHDATSATIQAALEVGCLPYAVLACCATVA